MSKFTERAWITVLVIPMFMMFFLAAGRSHLRMDRAIASEETEAAPLRVDCTEPPIVIVPLRRLDRVARKGLRFAISISPDVQAVLVVTNDPLADAQCATALASSWPEVVDGSAAAVTMFSDDSPVVPCV